jgi:hypothetical protein
MMHSPEPWFVHRTFNACAERQNTENFGGFLDLPRQTIIR